LKKKYSIKENTAVQKILARGRFFTCTSCVIYVMKNKTDKNNVAFLAGKKLGSAPVRNKAKRKLRVAMSTYWCDLAKGYDIILIARPLLLTRAHDVLMKDIGYLLRQHKLLNEKNMKRESGSYEKRLGDVRNEQKI